MAAFFASASVAVTTAVQLGAGVMHPAVPVIILAISIACMIIFATLWNREARQASVAQTNLTAGALTHDIPYGITGPGTSPPNLATPEVATPAGERTATHTTDAILVKPDEDLRVISALYGYQGMGVSIRDQLQSLVKDNKLEAQITNELAGGDPVPNQAKTLDVVYVYKGVESRQTVREGETLTLP
jgi:hypothetical protein